LGIVFCLVYGWATRGLFQADGPLTVGRFVVWLKIAVEMAFSFVATTMILVSLVYLCRPEARAHDRRVAPAAGDEAPTAGVIYLCCGDLDRRAVESLGRFRYPRRYHLVIHDDTPGGDPRVDALVRELSGDPNFEVHLLRRPEKEGGKPAAINHVLERTGDLYEVFLLCDNDSVAIGPDTLLRLVPRMADPRVAAVQCRNVSVEDPRACLVNRVLCRAIDVFHLILSMAQRFGWCPFVGHNALVRTEAVRAVGGMTPGCFADDIDLTVRWNLTGRRVEYAGDVPFGEQHPPSYAAFRKRTYKWAYGSMQVLLRHAWAVIRTSRLTFAEKWGFFQFIGFYTLQTVLLVYVTAFYLAGPFFLPREDFNLTATVLAGTVIPPLIFLPVIAFSLRHGRLRQLPWLVLTCWLGYGATDFPTARGTMDAFLRRPRRWVPTNSLAGGGLGVAEIAEALFGALLLLIPLRVFPWLLYAPLTLVFAAKFLFIPTMSLLYRDRAAAPGPPPVRRRSTLLARTIRASGIAVLALLLGCRPGDGPARPLLVDGKPYVVRGLHYSPWRPGTGPGRSEYPSPEQVEEDLRLIDRLRVNTLLVVDAPRHVLDAADRHGLRVLYAFWFEWHDFGAPEFEERARPIVATVRELRGHPAILGWMLGNEIPTWLVEKQGAPAVATNLRSLYARVKAEDPAHFVTHGNWPNTRLLDLGFLDVAGFNLYALWPPEVVALGYERFIREVLLPLAGEKPLLLTEYGADSLQAGEEGQARLARSCWTALRRAGCAGGFVFEFADEWWKNYSNPRFAGAWWDRVEALDDHARHDRDPEEHYGLVSGDRRPKPAFEMIAALYGREQRGSPGATALVLGLFGLAAASWLGALWRTRRRMVRPARPSVPMDEGARP
jgi:cellulose synthase/poly-beta-1,6-N-acetylglucosamine synthase-like glycosyltransferase